MTLLFEGHKLGPSKEPKSWLLCLLVAAAMGGAQEGIPMILGVGQRERMKAPPQDPLLRRATFNLPTFRWKPQDKLQFCMWPSVVTPQDRAQVFQVRNAASIP